MMDHFEIDVGFLADPRIKKLIEQQGGLSCMVYIQLLSMIYSSQQGYYIRITDQDITTVATSLRCRSLFVHEVIRSCYRLGLFYVTDPMVITSPSIQRRFLNMCRDSGIKASIADYCLIAENTTELAPKFPPTKDDVEQYIRQHQWDTIVSADEFHAYYSDINWCINGEPISDWRRKIEKWVSRRIDPSRIKRKNNSKPKARTDDRKPQQDNVDGPASAEEFRKAMGITGSIADFILHRKHGKD